MASDPIRPDIDAARSKMTSKIGAGREIKRLPDHLWEGEQVQMLASGQYGGGMGLVTLTDRRLFFLKDGVMKQVSEDFPFDKISSIQWNAGMIQGKIQVFVSGNKAEIEAVAKPEGKAIVDAVRNRISAGSASEPGQVSGSSDAGSLGQIEQLGSLHAAGLLTDEEFAAKKAQILGL